MAAQAPHTSHSSPQLNPLGRSSTSQNQPSQPDLEKQPWKYLGYKAFCEWSASDSDFFVLRRFGALNTRAILKMQDSIAGLEEELAGLDATHSRVDAGLVNNGSFRHDKIDRRGEILDEARAQLKEYNQYIAGYSELRSRPPAGTHEITNVENWLQYRHRGAIFKDETAYINQADDLMRLVPEHRSPLRKIMERCRAIIQSRFFKLNLQSKPLAYDPETTRYYNGDSLEAFARWLIIIVGLIMLIAPQWWLLFVSNRTYQLAIITGFIVLFLALVAAVSGAKPFESLAATAAYSAVLIVFMQFGNGAS